MAVNRDKPDRWKSDIAASVDFYNQWFLTFAPQTFRDARANSVEQVRQTISLTEQMKGFIEAKSAGDFTNTNKRRKEEAQKMNQLRDTYGENVRYLLFLCGYFDSGYLGYEAAEGIDWVWEHRIEDLEEFGV
jgi:hypothetical protein